MPLAFAPGLSVERRLRHNGHMRKRGRRPYPTTDAVDILGGGKGRVKLVRYGQDALGTQFVL